MESPDAIVLGAGPSGLGAALALARAGADVVMLEAAETVGGLCRTRHMDGHAYDVGGHIPFVNADARRAWLEDLLRGDLHWVDRPVSCIREGLIVRGRYLDQRSSELGSPAPVDAGGQGVASTSPRRNSGRVPRVRAESAPRRPGPSAAGLLGARFGAGFVDAVMRPYLEKIDGVPLEEIPAERALKLLETQSAPDGFWFPGGGIGALMDAMAREIAGSGGRVLTAMPVTALHHADGTINAVSIRRPDGIRRMTCRDLVVASPAAAACRLLQPAGDPLPGVRMRAVAIVCLEIALEAVGDEPWVQVDDPRIAFSRAYEPRNWSARMAPEGRTMLGLECYGSADGTDPVWEMNDDDLATRCADDLLSLGWCDSATAWRLLEVIRLPAAYPEFARDQLPAIAAPHPQLEAVEGVHLAPGSAVIEAIAAGEAAAEIIVGRRSAA